MRISKNQLKQLIEEEAQHLLNEWGQGYFKKGLRDSPYVRWFETESAESQKDIARRFFQHTADAQKTKKHREAMKAQSDKTKVTYDVSPAGNPFEWKTDKEKLETIKNLTQGVDTSQLQSFTGWLKNVAPPELVKKHVKIVKIR